MPKTDTWPNQVGCEYTSNQMTSFRILSDADYGQ